MITDRKGYPANYVIVDLPGYKCISLEEADILYPLGVVYFSATRHSDWYTAPPDTQYKESAWYTEYNYKPSQVPGREGYSWQGYVFYVKREDE